MEPLDEDDASRLQLLTAPGLVILGTRPLAELVAQEARTLADWSDAAPISQLVLRSGRINRSGIRDWVEQGRAAGLGTPVLDTHKLAVLQRLTASHDLGKPSPGWQQQHLNEREAQTPDALVIEAWKLNESLELFRSLDGLYTQLDAQTCLTDAIAEPPPSPPVPESLTIACGVRRLTVPLIPRAPGSGFPGLHMVTRDDCGTAAPTGGARAA